MKCGKGRRRSYRLAPLLFLQACCQRRSSVNRGTVIAAWCAAIGKPLYTAQKSAQSFFVRLCCLQDPSALQVHEFRQDEFKALAV